MKFYIKLFFTKNIDQIIDLANSYVFHGDLEKIIEVTYSYREIEWGFLLNETLFEEYLWDNYPKYSIDFLGRKYKYKIQVQIVLIDDILKKALKIKVCSRSESIRRGVFVEALEYVKNILEISVMWVEFELEKAGVAHKLTDKKVQKRVSEIEKREKLAFWPKVIDNMEEFSPCYNFIVRNHESRKKFLSEKDQKAMQKYLKIIRGSSSCELTDSPRVLKKHLKGSFLKKQISRKDYRIVFDSVCEFYGLPQKTKLSNAGSIYDGDNFLEIPRDEAHAFFTIERLLKLLTHEIESHYINSYNGKLLLWNFRGSKNLPKEEWLAMFMEKIFHGYSYENIDNIVEYFFTIMAGECLEWDKFEDFMRIMGKEYKCKRSYKSSVIRAKRNYSSTFIWVQHKDVVYFRGLTEIICFLKNGGQFKKLFLWKIGFHDVDNLFSIYESYENKQDLVFPIFISDLIYYYMIEKQNNSDFVFEAPEYYLYLRKKYWFVGLDSFDIIGQIQRKWKKIEKIIKLVEKASM